MSVSCCQSDHPGLCANDAHLSSTEVQRVYRRIAPVYDIWAKLTESRAASRAFDLAAPVNGEVALEVAVGTGLNFQKLVEANPNGKTIGVDFTPAMLERARKRLGPTLPDSVTFFEADAFDLPVGDQSCDLLMNQYMFDLIPQRDFPRLLNEFHRVLKSGGRLVLTNMTISETRIGRLYDALYRFSPALMGGCRGVRLAPALMEAGFCVERREYFQQGFFPSEVLLAYRI
jgi:ubiquinone/menaquinone biosynthesis C-methylase UbiE